MTVYQHFQQYQNSSNPPGYKQLPAKALIHLNSTQNPPTKLRITQTHAQVWLEVATLQPSMLIMFAPR